MKFLKLMPIHFTYVPLDKLLPVESSENSAYSLLLIKIASIIDITVTNFPQFVDLLGVKAIVCKVQVTTTSGLITMFFKEPIGGELVCALEGMKSEYSI